MGARTSLTVLVALVLSAAFGAGDQYLGSGHVWGIGWPTDVSLLSAPWLVLARVPSETSERLLSLLSTEQRTVAERLLEYEPATVGRLMTPDYVALRPEWTIGQALDQLVDRAIGAITLLDQLAVLLRQAATHGDLQVGARSRAR